MTPAGVVLRSILTSSDLRRWDEPHRTLRLGCPLRQWSGIPPGTSALPEITGNRLRLVQGVTSSANGRWSRPRSLPQPPRPPHPGTLHSRQNARGPAAKRRGAAGDTHPVPVHPSPARDDRGGPSRYTARVRAGRRRHPGRDSRGEDPVRPDGQKTTRGVKVSLTASLPDRPPAQLSGVFEPDQGRGQSGSSAHRPGGPGSPSRSRPSSMRASGAGCPMLEPGTTGVLA